MTKKCFRCGSTKDLDEFYEHPRMADGHLGKCKGCCKMEERLRRIEHPEKMAAYEKTRERSAYATQRTKKWRAMYPGRYQAQNTLNNAIRDGKIIKPTACEICGSGAHIHAHHEDYSEPKLVVWLCAKCHGQIQ